jgi:hypothetical protein
MTAAAIFSKLFRRKPQKQQALLVYVRLSDEQHGEHNEREDIFRLEDEMIKAIDDASAGEFDGNEFGGGFCTLYMYGTSTTQLWEAVAPVLRKFRLPAGSYAIKQFGEAGAPEEGIELAGRDLKHL